MRKQETKLMIGRGASMEVKATKPSENTKKPNVQKGKDLRTSK